MGSSSSIPRDKKIVIIGGGYAGIKLGTSLLKTGSDVTLIDVKDSFMHNNAAVRAIVEESIVPKLYINYKETFNEHFKQGRVVSINTDAKEVVMDGGDKVPYDVLVISTGCQGPFPAKLWDTNKEEGTKTYTEFAQKIKEGKRIGIIGGGAVGVEIAAEIGTDYKDKEVTLFHPKEELVQPGLGAKFHKKLKQTLQEKLKIKLVLGQKVSNTDELGDSGPYTLKTTGGEEHQVDVVITCTGISVNSLAYAQSLGGSMEENGALKVNEFLQVEGHENIFAMGDCTNVKEMKLAVNAQNQADHINKNLKLMFNNQQMKPYKPDSIPVKAVLSLGRSSGIGELKIGVLLPETFIVNLKSKNMLVPRFWEDMNQKLPK